MQQIWQILNRPLVIRPSVRRILLVAGSTSALVLLGSCIYALLPRSRPASETPAQLLRRAEGTYALKFPTNMTVVKSKAWIQHLPRSSPGRGTAIHFTCTASAWNQFEASFGTNFFAGGRAHLPVGYKVERQIPWITVIKGNWHEYFARELKPEMLTAGSEYIG